MHFRHRQTDTDIVAYARDVLHLALIPEYRTTATVQLTHSHSGAISVFTNYTKLT